MKIHIVNAHLTYPNWSEGTLNHAMAEKAKAHLGARGHDVTETVATNEDKQSSRHTRRTESAV